MISSVLRQFLLLPVGLLTISSVLSLHAQSQQDSSRLITNGKTPGSAGATVDV